jgi:hypothetical protein
MSTLWPGVKKQNGKFVLQGCLWKVMSHEIIYSYAVDNVGRNAEVTHYRNILRKLATNRSAFNYSIFNFLFCWAFNYKIKNAAFITNFGSPSIFNISKVLSRVQSKTRDSQC